MANEEETIQQHIENLRTSIRVFWQTFDGILDEQLKIATAQLEAYRDTVHIRIPFEVHMGLSVQVDNLKQQIAYREAITKLIEIEWQLFDETVAWVASKKETELRENA